MKNLILSFGIYDWLPYCSGISQENMNNRTEVMILCSERFKSSYKFPELCPDALDAQRVFELKKISKLLNISKISRMEFDCSDINYDKLFIQLELMVLFGGVDNIYCPCSNYDLDNTIKKLLCHDVINFYTYGRVNENNSEKQIKLDEKMYKNKQDCLYFTKGAQIDMCEMTIGRIEFFS